jgi:hypothetical protein
VVFQVTELARLLRDLLERSQHASPARPPRAVEGMDRDVSARAEDGIWIAAHGGLRPLRNPVELDGLAQSDARDHAPAQERVQRASQIATAHVVGDDPRAQEHREMNVRARHHRPGRAGHDDRRDRARIQGSCGAKRRLYSSQAQPRERPQERPLRSKAGGLQRPPDAEAAQDLERLARALLGAPRQRVDQHALGLELSLLKDGELARVERRQESECVVEAVPQIRALGAQHEELEAERLGPTN